MTAQVLSKGTSSMDATQNEVLPTPAGLNALTLDMVRNLQRQLDAWAQDSQVHAVVLRGAGEKAFCAGGDIRSLYDSFKNGDTLHLDFTAIEFQRPLVETVGQVGDALLRAGDAEQRVHLVVVR